MIARIDEFLHRHPVGVLTFAIALALGAIGGLAYAAGFAGTLHQALALEPEWLGYAAGFEIVAYVGYTLVYQATGELSGGARLPLWTALRLVAAGFGAFAVRGGFAMDHRALASVEKDPRAATVRVLAMGVVEYAVLAPAATVAAIVLLVHGPHVRAILTLPWIIGVPAGTAFALWASRSAHQRWLRRRSGRLRHSLADVLAGVAILRTLVHRPVHYAAAFLGAGLYWAGDIACLYASLRAFGYVISPAPLIVAYGTGYALTRRSLPMAGAGITEALLPYSLFLFGVPLTTAVVAVVAYRLFNFLVPMLPALAARSAVERLRAEAAARRPRPST